MHLKISSALVKIDLNSASKKLREIKRILVNNSAGIMRESAEGYRGEWFSLTVRDRNSLVPTPGYLQQLNLNSRPSPKNN